MYQVYELEDSLLLKCQFSQIGQSQLKAHKVGIFSFDKVVLEFIWKDKKAYNNRTILKR